MKKLMLSGLVMVLFSLFAMAQDDERVPGLYAVYGEESVPLTFIQGGTSTSSSGILGFEVSKQKKEYKGVTSDTAVPQGTQFVLVCDMSRKNIVQTLKKYDVFVSSITPNHMIIVGLDVAKKNREYDCGTKLNGFNTSKLGRVDFTWQQITDNSYLIQAELEPGEYAIVFKPAKLGDYNFDTIFDFTVTDEVVCVPAEEAAEEAAAPAEEAAEEPAEEVSE